MEEWGRTDRRGGATGRGGGLHSSEKRAPTVEQCVLKFSRGWADSRSYLTVIRCVREKEQVAFLGWQAPTGGCALFRPASTGGGRGKDRIPGA